jgi:hypothetical protein
LPQTSQAQKDQYQPLAAKFQAQTEKLSRVIRVNPVELGNFVNLNPGAKPTNIILAKGKIYAADSTQSAIYTIDIGSKLITAINLNGPKSTRLDYPSLDKNNNIYYLGTNEVGVLDIKSEKSSSLNINFSGDLEKAIDLKQYNNRFYLADSASGQIYRFTKNGDELTSPTPWLNSKENLADAAGMDIDGNIYLLKNNGEILKYAKGKKQDFPQTAVEPAMSRATAIKVPPESNYIYIFEPANKRLIVLNKDGKFNCQYTSDKLDDLKDFQIDEKNNKIYFLNDSTVYSVDMSHLGK